MKKHRKIAPYKPLPWQIKPWRDKSPIVLLAGPAGTGKSKLAAEKIHAYLMKYPGSTGVILRKTRESMTNSTVLFFERSIVGMNNPLVVHKKADHRFEYWNGSILAYGGMKDEAQREQIRGIGIDAGIDIAWMEEATRFEENDFNELIARMRGRAAPWQQMILSTNPGPPSHWINQLLILGGGASVYDKARPEDNPYNPPAYIERLKKLTGILRQRLWDGLWVQAEGLVYQEFDLDNLVDTEQYPDVDVELAFDDGYIDPRAILFVQRTPTEILVFDELYQTKKLEEQSVEDVLWKMQHYFGSTYDDIDPEDRPDDWDKDPSPKVLPEISVGSPEANQLKKRFQLANIPARSKPHKVVEGIKVVRELICDGNGYRTLKVNRRCKNFISELTEGYKYPEGNKRDNEKPEDGNDHACDAFRYWAFLRAKV